MKRLLAVLSTVAMLAATIGLAASANAVTGPSAPQNLLVASADTQLILTWDAPTSDGGSPITGYRIVLVDTATLDAQPVEVTVGVVQTYTFTQLTNGTEYFVEMYAFNAVAPGTPVSVPGTPRAPTVPSPPLNLVVTPGDSELSLTWDDPDSDGGSNLTGYTITWNSGATPILANIGVTNSYTITGLTNGTNYTVIVQAVNSVGAGALVANNGTPELGPGAPSRPIVPNRPASTPAPEDDTAPQTVTVNWNAGEGTCSYATSTVTVGTTVTAPGCAREGYVFKDWDRSYPVLATSDITVTAKWQQIPGNMMPGASTLLPKSVKFTYGYIGTVPVDTFVVINDKGQLACSSVQTTEFANTCTAVGFGEGTYYVFAQANGVDGPQAEIVVAKEKTITITDCERRSDRIECFGTSTGYDKGAILSPWVRFPGETRFNQGTAQILVDDEGNWSWGRKTPKRTAVQIRSEDDNVRSNTAVVEAR